MLMYALIGLLLVLVGITGLQFTYLFYVNRIYGERKKYLQHLEHKCANLTTRLKSAERRIARQNKLIKGDEIWADVIEDR